jgi:hypothetical protein
VRIEEEAMGFKSQAKSIGWFMYEVPVGPFVHYPTGLNKRISCDSPHELLLD